MIDTSQNGNDVLYHYAKFEGDRTTHAGCRCENIVFVCFLSRSQSGVWFVRRGQNLNKYCVTVYRSILMLFHRFFGRDCPFRQIRVPIFVARWRHNFHKIAVENWKNSRNTAEKFVHTTSCRQLRDMNTIPPPQFRVEKVDVHLHKNFSTRRYIQRWQHCQNSHGQSPNMARNEQVHMHQKSYSK